MSGCLSPAQMRKREGSGMSAAERPDSKIPTRNPQPASGVPGRGRAPAGPGRAVARRRRDPASAAAGSAGSAVPGSRAATMTDQGITVYPARCEGDRWRAVWYEPDGWDNIGISSGGGLEHRHPASGRVWRQAVDGERQGHVPRDAGNGDRAREQHSQLPPPAPGRRAGSTPTTTMSWPHNRPHPGPALPSRAAGCEPEVS
jgi:hypothetical protein